MRASSSELGSSAFQIFTKTEKIEEEGALTSLQTGIAKYHNKNVHVIPVLNTIFGTYNWDPRVYAIIGIYHPPRGTDQQFSNSKFIDQFTDLLT